MTSQIPTNFVWKPARHKYASGQECWLGKICIGSYFNPTVRKGEPTVYRAATVLPGIVMKGGTTDFPNDELARARVEAVARTWFNWIQQEN